MINPNQIKIDVGTSRVVTATLKRNAFNLFIEPENNLWTYDLSGRLVGVFYDSKTYRRTLNNRFYLKTRQVIENEEFRDVEITSKEVANLLIDTGIDLCGIIKESLPERHREVIDKIIQMDTSRLEADGKTFSEIYLPISILPPDQYLSLVVQVTEGCNYNKCTFCDFYRDRPFKIKTEAEVGDHLIRIRSFLKEGVSLRNSIFLADANAIVTPMNRLRNMIGLIHNEFPEKRNLYSFIDVFTGLKKSIDDLKELKQLGLNRVYLGIESGHLPLLQFLKKPQDLEAIVELTSLLKEASINIGVIFLVGAGGTSFVEKHQIDSIKLVKRLNLGKGDMVYVSEFNETNHEYVEQMSKAGYSMPSRSEIRTWSKAFKDDFKSNLSKDIKIAVYDIKQFFY